MSGLRGWILLLAGVSFLAGIPVGALIAGPDARGVDGGGAFDDYDRLLSDEFDLTPDRRRALRVILADYEDALDEIRSRQLDHFEDDVLRAGRLCRDRIRNVLIPEPDRPRFDALVAGLGQQP
ncbi:MAG: hypothetical protein AAFZ65_06415 [Planctomycetota bacterium]